MSNPISLVLIDDHPSVPGGVVARLRAQPGFHVLATGSETETAVRKVCETRPDVVLLSVRREGKDSLTLAGALHGAAPDARVIIMGMRQLHEDVTSFVRAGVFGFIMADATFDCVLGTIQSVAGGSRALPPELTGSLFRQINGFGVRRDSRIRVGADRLTRRERDVAQLIVLGMSNKDIATRMTIALHTVKSHVHNVLSKLAINSRLEVAALSRSSPKDLIPIPSV